MALTASDLSDMSAGLARARQGAAEAAELADLGWLSSGWSSLIGSDSTAAAARSSAAASASLVASLEARYVRLAADPAAGAAERNDFLRACGVAVDNRELAAATDSLSPATAAGEVAAGAAQDLRAGAAAAVGALPSLALVAAAIVLVVLIVKES